MPKDMHLPFERILLTLWVGGMWVTGFIVTPVIFSSITDRMLAGAIAGRLFSILSLVGLACGGALLLIRGFTRPRPGARDWRLWILVAMLGVTAVGEFGLAPRMRALKAGVGAEHGQFVLLHRTASVLFLANSFMGLLLVAARPFPPKLNHGP